MKFVRSGSSSLSLLVAASAALLACEKAYPRENVKPFTFPAPDNGTLADASTFVPSDAGAADAGEAGDSGSLSACVAPTGEAGPFTKLGLLESIAACTVYQYCELEGLAHDFVAKTAANAAAPTEATAQLARDSWFFLLQRVQLAEFLQFGPAASRMEPGGLGLRNEMYSFPTTSRCKIDEQIVDKTYEQSTFKDSDYTARGLSAAEYLLFSTGTENGCSQLRNINAQGTWAALSADEIATRKAHYAAAVAEDVLSRIQALRNAWDPAGGNFTQQLTRPGAGSVYRDEQAALNAVGSALFYFDKELKDWKIARPASLTEDCMGDCTGLRESLYANVGAKNIESNVAGLALIAQGCGEGNQGLGFDDWLRALGQDQLADDTIAAIGGARAAALALEPSLEQVLASNAPLAQATLAKFKAVTDILKADMTTALDLELPMSVASDND